MRLKISLRRDERWWKSNKSSTGDFRLFNSHFDRLRLLTSTCNQTIRPYRSSTYRYKGELNHEGRLHSSDETILQTAPGRHAPPSPKDAERVSDYPVMVLRPGESCYIHVESRGRGEGFLGVTGRLICSCFCATALYPPTDGLPEELSYLTSIPIGGKLQPPFDLDFRA